MKSKRRDFIKQTSLGSMSLLSAHQLFPFSLNTQTGSMENEPGQSIIGQYGPWAASMLDANLPSLSFRNTRFNSLESWRKSARQQLKSRLAIPKIVTKPKISVTKSFVYDDLQIEELTWSLSYGRPTQAILLKPKGHTGKLPGVLAFHDHGGNKYFGTRKITKTSDEQHPMMVEHQQLYYEGRAWANELAKRGYVVLVSDAFPFASRRVMMQDLPVQFREGMTDDHPEEQKHINAYNKWAGQHEHIMSKSLLSAGTTWPGVFYYEDKVALDILSARADVDASKIGCCGLSGGGMRTVFMAGADDRIKCAIPVGFMTTWKDFVINVSYTHTWMTYVPLLPNEMDFPEILSLNMPSAALVLNNNEDQLFTLSEMKRSDAILTEVYAKAGMKHKYKTSFYPGPHKFDKAMQLEAFDWFDKWLS